MASAVVLVTKPWHVPLSYASWVTFQSLPTPLGLTLGGHVEGMDEIPVAVGVLGRRLVVGPEREPVASTDQPEDVVERVVLHHHDHECARSSAPGRCRRDGRGEGANRALATIDGPTWCSTRPSPKTSLHTRRAGPTHQPIRRREIVVGSDSPCAPGVDVSGLAAPTIDHDGAIDQVAGASTTSLESRSRGVERASLAAHRS